MRGAADGLALSSNALASDAVCRCRDDYGSGAGLGFYGGVGMSKPDDIPQDVWDKAKSCVFGMEPNMNDDELLGNVKRVARAIQTAKLEAYQEAAKAAEALANDGLTDSRNPVYLLLDLARDIRKLGEGK